ncbi:calpain-A-like isoform X2 [Centruroides sculpturatus]|uniref:calpain-A-like isoform X2 n=1 Tax=Centruroides sculpturatus TaxID=218467 RepID=UPI000C6CAD74|nr:calpain-A-like isoform X2 [Centruroides sculpturatus]
MQEHDNVMKIESLTIGQLFVDIEFPPKNSSIFFNNPLIDGKVTWMRPHELIDNPRLLVDGVSQHDIIQGILADCWFLSSCAAVAQYPTLMRKVIPSNQPLYGTGYKGFIWFQFWQYGKWVTVYIDDLLPTKDGRLIFSRCSDNREFWVALLEKAYAKLHKSYEALEGGQAMDALVDLTGGLAERYDLDDAPSNLYDILLKASSNGAFITCSRKGDWRTANVADNNGLVAGHAYTVTAVANVCTVKGCWEQGCTAGGSRNNLELFSLNPQYLLTVLNISDVYKECPKISMIIALMQIRQYCRKHNKSRMLQIGFAVYKTKTPHKRLSRYFFVKNSDVGNSGPYINYREIFKRFEMNPGSYVIIPATFEPNCPGSFLIRIYADSPFRVKELK